MLVEKCAVGKAWSERHLSPLSIATLLVLVVLAAGFVTSVFVFSTRASASPVSSDEATTCCSICLFLLRQLKFISERSVGYKTFKRTCMWQQERHRHIIRAPLHFCARHALLQCTKTASKRQCCKPRDLTGSIQSLLKGQQGCEHVAASSYRSHILPSSLVATQVLFRMTVCTASCEGRIQSTSTCTIIRIPANVAPARLAPAKCPAGPGQAGLLGLSCRGLSLLSTRQHGAYRQS